MSNHKVEIRLRHMLDYSREAVAMAKDKTRAELDADRKLNLSLVRLLEVVGEAASQVPRVDRAQYPAIPWPDIVGLRNRLIHAYEKVDLKIVWEIVTQDLPPLIAELEKILEKEPGA